MNYRNIENRLDKLDSGNAKSDEKTLFIVPKGDTPPPEYNPAKHGIIWDNVADPLPGYGLSRNELSALLKKIDGKTRSL